MITRRFVFSLFLLFMLPLVGTAGYMHLEGWSFQDALYMSVITMSTVGFGEVRELSVVGEWFTIGYIFLCVTCVGFAVTSITAFWVQGELRDLLKGRRMQRRIDQLKDHYILCGCGAVGREIVMEFTRSKVPFVVVEKTPEEAEIPRDLDLLFIQGDATDEEVLEMAGIRRARGLIAALRSDPENVFVTLTARQLNPELQIVARAGEKGTESKLLRAGADRVISPFEIAGQRMASIVLRPHVVNFLDVVNRESGVNLRLEEVHIAPGSGLVGKSLRESDLGRTTGAVIIGVHEPGGQPRITPASNISLSRLVLHAGDILIALGNDEQIELLEKVAGGEVSLQKLHGA